MVRVRALANGKSARPSAPHAGEAIALLPRHGPQDHPFEVGGQPRAVQVRRVEVALGDGVHEPHEGAGLGGEGAHAGGAFVQDHAQRVLIGPCVQVAVAPRQLGRDIVRRAQKRRVGGQLGGGVFHDLRDAEVEHLCRDIVVPAPRQEDVGGLQIAVHHPLHVGGVHRRQHRQHQIDQLRQIEGALAAEVSVQRLAVQVLHHQARQPVDHADVRHVDDVRVANARSELTFAQEARHDHVVLGVGPAQRLDGDALAEPGVHRFVHLAHAPGADAPLDGVLAHAGAGGQIGGLLGPHAREVYQRWVPQGPRRAGRGTVLRMFRAISAPIDPIAMATSDVLSA